MRQTAAACTAGRLHRGERTVMHRGLLLMLRPSGRMMLRGRWWRQMRARLQLGKHLLLLLHLLLHRGQLRRLLGSLSRRRLRQVRLMKAMYRLLLLNCRDRGGHVHTAHAVLSLIV